MNNHIQTVMESAAIAATIAVPTFLAIVHTAVRISRLETKIEPMWEWWLNHRHKRAEDAPETS